MTTDRKHEYLVSLVHELSRLPQETERWSSMAISGCSWEWLAGRHSALLNLYLVMCYSAQGLFDGYLITTALADSSTVGCPMLSDTTENGLASQLADTVIGELDVRSTKCEA